MQIPTPRHINSEPPTGFAELSGGDFAAQLDAMKAAFLEAVDEADTDDGEPEAAHSLYQIVPHLVEAGRIRLGNDSAPAMAAARRYSLRLGFIGEMQKARPDTQVSEHDNIPRHVRALLSCGAVIEDHGSHAAIFTSSTDHRQADALAPLLVAWLTAANRWTLWGDAVAVGHGTWAMAVYRESITEGLPVVPMVSLGGSQLRYYLDVVEDMKAEADNYADTPQGDALRGRLKAANELVSKCKTRAMPSLCSGV